MPPQFGPFAIREFKPDDVIFRQGDEARREAYMIRAGKVQVRKHLNGTEQVLKTLGQGDLLGEIALFRSAAHSATAVALDRVVLMVVPADRLEHMVRTHPDLAIALIRQLARMAAGDADTGR